MRDDPEVRIVVNNNEVTIHTHGDTIIIQRSIYDQMPNVRSNLDVQKNLSRTFEVIENDDAIENFGLTPENADQEPLVQIPREKFITLASAPTIAGGDSGRRERIERARLVILKVWLTPGNRKWSFEWNGVPISAPIKDQAFWQKLARREYLIGHGDALDVKLKYQQIYDEALGIYVNDPHTFEVVEVMGSAPRTAS